MTKNSTNFLFEAPKKKSCAHLPSVLRNLKRVTQQQIDFAELLPQHWSIASARFQSNSQISSFHRSSERRLTIRNLAQYSESNNFTQSLKIFSFLWLKDYFFNNIYKRKKSIIRNSIWFDFQIHLRKFLNESPTKIGRNRVQVLNLRFRVFLSFLLISNLTKYL